jgi:hypothetical protein
MSNILHNHFFLILACLIKLAMSLIDVVLDLRELLHSPLAHIDQCPHLLPRSRIQSGQCALEFPRELRIVRGHEVEQIQGFLQSNELSRFLRLGSGCLKFKVFFEKSEEVESGFELTKG